jgi:Domain of unknown function (DUF4825)
MRKCKTYKLAFVFILALFSLLACSNKEEENSKTIEDISFDDLSSLEETTIGNNSDVINIVSELAAGQIEKQIELTSNSLKIEYDLAKYNEEKEEAANYWYKEENQERNVRFNSAVLFSLIPNLETVDVLFISEKDVSHTIDRQELSNELEIDFQSWNKDTFNSIKEKISE